MRRRKLNELKIFSTKIRKHVVESIYNAGCGHPGGSLSIADLLAVLYSEIMNVNPLDPKWEDRDRLVLSKGHAAPALYGALAERGFFATKELEKLRQADSFLQGHPDIKIPGVDMSTGSLGQGFSTAIGMALAAKIDRKDYRVYVILGDGELEEGQVWEAAMCAAHYNLDNLTAFIDHNGLQIDGPITEVMSPEVINDKFKAFGWNVTIADGHDFMQIIDGIELAKSHRGQPTVIILETVKGKGVSYMENEIGWHGTAPNREQRERAMAELDAVLSDLDTDFGGDLV